MLAELLVSLLPAKAPGVGCLANCLQSHRMLVDVLGMLGALMLHMRMHILSRVLWPFTGLLAALLLWTRASQFVEGGEDAPVPVVVMLLHSVAPLGAPPAAAAAAAETDSVEAGLICCRRFAFVFQDVLGLLILRCVARSLLNLRFVRSVRGMLGNAAFGVLKKLPVVKDKVEAEVGKIRDDVRKIVHEGRRGEVTRELPEDGRSHDELLGVMEAHADEENEAWADGRISGAVYNGEDDVLELTNAAYAAYTISNPLHPDVWPSVSQMEAEIVSMVANLLGGGDSGVCGSLTSGGTESIILAAKSHRNFFREKGICRPEIVVAESAHAAIEKACDLMDIKLVRIPVNPKTFKVDVAAMENAIGPNTILLYASAPTYPQGVIDDVQALGAIARRYDIGLHVDCCLGGFVLPFARELGYNIPPFDFGVKGVTSMSVDTHKFGYTTKGTSVVLYRNEDLRRHQYWTFPDWMGGLYSTATIAGSRPGGLIAASWAAMVHIGKQGYLDYVDDIMQTAQTFKEGLEKIDGVRVVGDTPAMIVCFAGDEGVHTNTLFDIISKKGWSLNLLQSPPGIHLCVTVRHVATEDRDPIADLLEVVKDAVRETRGISEEEKDKNSVGAIYGMAASLPPGPVSELMCAYLDAQLST